jgi:hypothetical protein
MMYVSYKFNQFKEIDRRGNTIRFEGDLNDIPLPSYVLVNTEALIGWSCTAIVQPRSCVLNARIATTTTKPFST